MENRGLGGGQESNSQEWQFSSLACVMVGNQYGQVSLAIAFFHHLGREVKQVRIGPEMAVGYAEEAE
jgi:hypothetical protein